MRSMRSISLLSLAAAAALAVLSGRSSAETQLEYREISPIQVIVSVVQDTPLEITWAEQAVSEYNVLLQHIGFVDPTAGAKGRINVLKSLDAPFTLRDHRAAMGGKDLHDLALLWLEGAAQDASVELIQRINIVNGIGHIAYARAREFRCLVAQTAYNFEFPRAGGEQYDTVVTMWYCDQHGEFREIVTFLKNLRLVGSDENRAVYAARTDEDVNTEDAEPGPAGAGTGFFVNRLGHIVTNFHVVSECTAVGAQHGDSAGEVTFVAGDPSNDLALLKWTGQVPSDTVTLRQGRDVSIGEGVMAVGFPFSQFLGSQPKVTTGIVSSTAGPADDVRILQVTSPVQPGSSGGPLLDESGNVVGVVVGGLGVLEFAEATGKIPQNINFAIKASVVRSFLDTH